MKEKLKKIALILQKIFGWGILVSLFVGGFSFFGYLVAFFIGGNTATEICDFIYNKIYPILFYFTSIIVILGLICMYLKGETALKSGNRKAKQSQQPKTVEEKEIKEESTEKVVDEKDEEEPKENIEKLEGKEIKNRKTQKTKSKK